MTLRVEVPGEKVVSVEPCKYIKPYVAELKSETNFSRGAKDFLKKAWAFRSLITVEPFIICYVLPSVLTGLAVQRLSLEKSCLVNLNYNETVCNSILRHDHHFQKEEYSSTKMVTDATAWSFPLQSALPGILILFVGSWTDRTGNRKTFMVLPILGKLISAIGIILSIICFYQVDLNGTMLIEGLPPAVAGGRVAMTMAVYSYVTDITTEAERTFRLGIITAILTMSRPIGLALSGFMIKFLGYYVVFMIACVMYLLGFVYIVLRLREKGKKTVDSENTVSILSAFSVRDVVSTVNVALRTRQSSRRLQILLILFAYMLLVGPNLGESQFTYWFAQQKFHFDEVDYGLFSTYSVVVGSLGSFITIYILSKRCGVEDSVIGIVACVSRISACVVYALAPTRNVYYLGPLLDMFSSAGATSLRSIATKLVDSDEVGKTSSLISISEALVPVVYTPVYSMVYGAGVGTPFPGAFYLLSTGLGVLAIAVLIYLFTLRRSEAVDTPPTQENKSKDNEVTRF